MSSTKPVPAAKVSDVVTNFAPTRSEQRFAPTPSQKPYHVTSLDFDDTGELALISQTDDTLQIYNCKQGVWARELKSQKYGVDLARFSHHAQSIIYASTKNDDAIRYLSSHDNSYIRYFRGHTAPVTCISLDPSSDSFVSASADSTVRLWDLRSSSSQGVLNLKQAFLVVYDPTATVMAVACPAAQQVILYDARNYDKAPFATFDLRDMEQALRDMHHKGRGSSSSVGDAAPVLSEGVNNDWTKLEFSNDGQKLLVATAGGGHWVLNAFDGTLVAYLARPLGPTNRVAPAQVQALRQRQAAAGGGAASGGAASGQGDACFSPDGRYVIGGSGEGGLYVWDCAAAAGEEVEAGPGRVLQPAAELAQGNKAVGQSSIVGYNPRHNLLVTADKSVIFWLPEMD